MQYKIVQLRVKNFKCFDDEKYYEFTIDDNKNPIILSGPNGFGKTTFFDAIELVFSKQITRFETSIEKKTTNLGKNILLNKADKDGYIVLTLKNEKEHYLTIFTLISNSVHKLDVENSIKYGVKKTLIETNELDSFIKDYVDWKDDLAQHKVLKFSEKNFNVYYYVSQAESVHFLKRNIADRKDAMNVLLNTTLIDKKVNFIWDKLIGKRSNTKGVIVNDEISEMQTIIKDKILQIRNSYTENEEIEFKDVEYVELLGDVDEIDKPFWDKRNINNHTVAEIYSAINDIESLYLYTINKDDYEKYIWNEKIKKLLNKNIIKDYLVYYRYFVENKISENKIKTDIENMERIISVYTYSSFFRAGRIEFSKYKQTDMEKLNELISGIIDFDLTQANSIIVDATSIQKTLSQKQSVINELEKARKILQEAKQKYNEDSEICPFCGHEFKNVIELDKAFGKVENDLREESGNSLEKIREKEEEFFRIVQKSKKAVNAIIDGYDDEKIKEIIMYKSNLQEFIKDTKRITEIENLVTLIDDVQTWKNLNASEQEIEVQRIIFNKMKSYENKAFIMECQKKDYSKLLMKYDRIINYCFEKLSNKEIVDEKIKYLKKCIWERENFTITKFKEEIKQNIIRLEKLKRVRNNLDNLQKMYNISIDNYKNLVLKKLRIPLLIYTGKILQDYQNGLGVFINKDEMRFVSTGEAKHDILNTFSSGQLSGFVLAFLFSMNKQYIKESSDDVGFMLIDDPVQTMDDINISSLIEVLRNDFAQKQIILSTHETDKENYILYKFYKYNQIGQSFNVKEELYKV